jgi:CBS domain containing-hemolysin-like protein
VIALLNGLGNAVLRAFGLQPGNAEDRLHSTEELKLLVAASKDAGLVQPAQQEVVERAFSMGELRVRSIMTPRLDVQWIDADDPHEAMLRAIRDCRHEQVVVARTTLDDVVGILRKQDLLDAHLDGQMLDPVAAVREPLMVHDAATVLQVFEAFKDRPVQMALVIDEYGVLQGLVTQTDLLEALAGDIPDDDDDPEVTPRADGSFLIDGATPIEKAFAQLALTTPPPGGDYETLAGFALRQLQHIPAAGESFEWEGCRFEVLDMDALRIDKLLVVPGKESAGGGEGEGAATAELPG